MSPHAPDLPRLAPWVALASIGLVAAFSVVGWPWLERRRGRARAEAARAALGACLGASDDDVLRARAIAADREGSDWPERCLEGSAELEVALRRILATHETCEGGCCVDDAACMAIEHERARLLRLRDQLGTGLFEGAVVDTMLDPVPAPVVAPPPRREALSPIANAGFDVTALVDTVAGPSVLLHSRGRNAHRCDLDRDEARLDCQPLPPAIPVAGNLLLVDGAPAHPLRLLVEEDDGWSLRRPDGSVVVRWDGPPVSATHDAALVEEAEGFTVVGADERRDVAPGPTPLLFGEVLYRTAQRDGALYLERRDRWRHDQGSSTLLPRLDAGQIRLQACRGEGARVVATGRDSGGTPTSVAVFDDGDLTAVPIPSTPAWYGLTCHGNTVNLAWIEEEITGRHDEAVEGRYRVGRIRCTPQACVPQEVTVELERHHRGSRYVVADLGEAMALVWRSHLGDVRVRVAPLSELMQATTETLFDDAAHDGLSWDGRPAALVPGDGYALLLAQDEERRSYGWLLEPTGPRPLRPAEGSGAR